MLCLYASSPTAVTDQESFWQVDWHSNCPISTVCRTNVKDIGRKRKSQSTDWTSSLSVNLSIWFMAPHSCRGTSIEAEHFAGGLETPGSLPSPGAVFWNKILLLYNLVVQGPKHSLYGKNTNNSFWKCFWIFESIKILIDVFYSSHLLLPCQREESRLTERRKPFYKSN